VVALAAGGRFVWSWWAPVAGCGCLVELLSPFPLTVGGVVDDNGGCVELSLPFPLRLG
jgi:hypothetical protein